MRSHNSARIMADRMESVVIGPDPITSEPKSTYLLNSSSRPGLGRTPVRRMQMPATLRDGIAEILADIDGLPVLFRILVKDAPAQIQSDLASKDVDIHSLLSSTLEKMADWVRDPSRPSRQRLSIMELMPEAEPLAGLPAPPSETALRGGWLQLDLLDRTARRGDRKIDLRPREFLLLK